MGSVLRVRAQCFGFFGDLVSGAHDVENRPCLTKWRLHRGACGELGQKSCRTILHS